MRLNWSLKHSTAHDNVDIKPIGVEQYLTEWGHDLFIPFMLKAYIDLDKLKLESDMVVKVKALQREMNLRTYDPSNANHAERYNLWDGVMVSLILDKKGVPLPKYQPNDRNLRIQYMKIRKVNGSPQFNKFEVNLTKQRYTHLCPMEYYNYTQDLPELD